MCFAVSMNFLQISPSKNYEKELERFESKTILLIMEYRRFGKTEESISVITLGGMRFKHGWNPPRSLLPKESIQNCIEITQQALALGINHIETAHGYMKSEHLYGMALKELAIPRDQFKIMTKGAPMTGDETRALVEEQLENLQLDFVDFSHSDLKIWSRIRTNIKTRTPNIKNHGR